MLAKKNVKRRNNFSASKTTNIPAVKTPRGGAGKLDTNLEPRAKHQQKSEVMSTIVVGSRFVALDSIKFLEKEDKVEEEDIEDQHLVGLKCINMPIVKKGNVTNQNGLSKSMDHSPTNPIEPMDFVISNDQQADKAQSIIISIKIPIKPSLSTSISMESKDFDGAKMLRGMEVEHKSTSITILKPLEMSSDPRNMALVIDSMDGNKAHLELVNKEAIGGGRGSKNIPPPIPPDAFNYSSAKKNKMKGKLKAPSGGTQNGHRPYWLMLFSTCPNTIQVFFINCLL